ncbi:alpha/beta hydrolase fold domain-containing protein [Thiotrichales bacterium 19S3-7]|nr:alpha/beta hydrolase fold domain-containing protein [Thiotrichales bacterium 19S3-7]MCF6801178.1 alpha/beta hydrolase fold domain-containing protein [Thiotrichales bacterium 19S3-11]
MWAIVGSSGFEHFDEFEIIEELSRETPYGLCSNGLYRIKYHDQEALFLCRTGYEQNILPSHINYRANIFALKKYGTTAILALSSVRSIQSSIKPGEMVIPYQYIDRTKALRSCTFCDDSLLGYVSLSQPISEDIAEVIKQKRDDFSFNTHFGSVYVCIEGPQFPTMVEARCYQRMGGGIIGMTAFPEYALAREAGLFYLPCHFVVDYVPTSNEHHPFESVLQIRSENQSKALDVISWVLAKLNQYSLKDCNCEGLAGSLTATEEMLTPNQRAWFDVITKSNAQTDLDMIKESFESEFYYGTQPLPKKLADFLQFINKHKAGKKHSTLEEVRKNADSLIFYADKAPDVASVREFTVKVDDRQVKVRLYHPDPEKLLPIMVYAHGGGFVAGNLDSFDTPCRELALHTNRVVISVDYHLAPEYPFPTQIEDVQAVIHWAYHHASDIKASNDAFVVMGDSAGANLIAMAVSRLKHKNDTVKFAAQILLYPTVDFSHKTFSMKKFAHGYLLEADSVIWYNKAYVPESMEMTSAEISPLYVDNLSDMPTTFVMTAGYDPLRDEGLIYAEKLKALGVTVRHYHFDNLIHGFINFSKLIPHEMEVFYNRVAAFTKQL